MANDRHVSDPEIAELRDEIRRLREAQEQHSSGPSSDGDKKEQEDNDEDQDQARKKPHPLRRAVIAVAAALIIVVALLWWLHARQFETTDDAIVDGHTSGIAARVAGTIVAVYVEENQSVKAGQVVVDLDPRDYQMAVAQADMQLRQAQAQTEAEQPNIPVIEVTNSTSIATSNSEIRAAEAETAAAQRNYQAAQDKVAESQATSAKAQADVARFRPLAEKDEVPREQFDQVVATAKAMAAAVAANQAGAQAALQQVDQARARLAEARKRAQQVAQNAPRQLAIGRATVQTRRAAAEGARVQLKQALLNLSYCKVTTPVSGIIAKRTAEVGQRVTAGQQVLLVAQIDDLWVTANYRETQLRRMHPGQGARIHVDALAADFDGYVESMPAASGAVTSLLPPENATGNFVKVVQRLPVRIRFKKGQAGLERLRPGMSVEPKVRVE